MTLSGLPRERSSASMALPYPTRSAIARLENGDLWVWSPVKLTAGPAAEVDRLGPVRHLVSPTSCTISICRTGRRPIPSAQLWGPQSTIRKRARPHVPRTAAGHPTARMASRHRSGVVSRFVRHGRDCLSSSSLSHRNRRRPDPDLQRSISQGKLGLVALRGAPGWPYPGPGVRAPRMAIIVYQPRTGPPGARQSVELELPARDCCPRRVAARQWDCLSCKVI